MYADGGHAGGGSNTTAQEELEKILARAESALADYHAEDEATAEKPRPSGITEAAPGHLLVPVLGKRPRRRIVRPEATLGGHQHRRSRGDVE